MPGACGLSFFNKTHSREISCDPSLAWDILSDYATWTQWMPKVNKSLQTAREANFARVELEIAGRSMPAECIHTADSKVLVKSRSGQMPEFVLDWSISPGGEGRTLIAVKCTGLPALKPERLLDAFSARAAGFASDPNTGPTDPATILEIYETEQGLMCWYRGKKYEMKAVS
jgi:hypothetical protein